MTTPAPVAGEGARDRVAKAPAPAGHDRNLVGELAPGVGSACSTAASPPPLPCHAIAWKRLASSLIRFAVSMSRSVIFMPASWVQNENETML